LSEAKAQGINLHIWSHKEIENYLLCPGAICRVITKNRKSQSVTEAEILKQINIICEDLKEDVLDCYATEIKNKDNSKGVKTANQEARNYINPLWDERKGALVSGKDVISKLGSWITENQKVSINRFVIAREMMLNEINDEVVNLIKD
jgi:hypothetical protein